MILELIITSTIIYSLQYMGPYAFLGTLFWLFHRYQPRWYPRFISVLGFSLSEKSFYYLWFLQVAGNSRGSIVEVTIGILCGIIYTTALHSIVDVPDSVAKPFAAIGERLGETPMPILVPFQNQQQQQHQRQQVGPRQPVHPVFGREAPPGTAQQIRARQRRPPEPDQAAVEQLQMMGFDLPQIREALQFCDNDIQRAADRLLQQQGVS
jgi:hypothetical protein